MRSVSKRSKAASRNVTIVSILAMACASAMSGCSMPSSGSKTAGATVTDFSYDPLSRIDHYHSAPNATNADEAFNAFSSPISVLAGAVNSNLQSQKELTETVAAADEKLHAQLLSDMTTSTNWIDLRNTVLTELGVPVFDKNGTPISDHKGALSSTQQKLREEETTARIILRQQKVAAIAQVLALIGNAQAALVKQGADNLQRVQLAQDAANLDKAIAAFGAQVSDKRLSQQVVDLTEQVNNDLQAFKLNPSSNTTPDTAKPSAAPATVLKNASAAQDAAKTEVANGTAVTAAGIDQAQFLECILNNVVAAGQEFAAVNAKSQTANSQQIKLLAAIQNSKDPSSAFALVAVVGTGLDDDSFALLDKYIVELNKRLPAPDPTGMKGMDVRSQALPPDVADTWAATRDQYAITLEALAAAYKIVDAETNVKTDIDSKSNR